MTQEEKFDARYAKLANGRKQDAGTDLRDRAKGALWGLIIGDCLGSPVEFRSRTDHKWIDQMEPCPHWNLPKGYLTDDSSMAFCIMQAFIDHPKGFNPEHVAKHFANWMLHGEWSCTDNAFDVGTSCRNGIWDYVHAKSLKNGDEHSQGNGGIMRFAPSWFVARKLFAAKGEQTALMHDINDVTHNSSVARKTITTLAEVFDEHIAAGRRTAIETTAKDWRTANNSGWCVSTLDTALWAVNTTSNFRDTLVAAVNLGGDADTIGAVCGQIAGSYYGFSSIPKRWLTDIKDWQKVNALIDSFLDITIRRIRQ